MANKTFRSGLVVGLCIGLAMTLFVLYWHMLVLDRDKFTKIAVEMMPLVVFENVQGMVFGAVGHSLTYTCAL